MDYIVVSTLCIISLIIGIVCLAENELFSHKKKNRFMAIAVIILVEILIDTVSLVIDYNQINFINLYKVLKIMEFIIAPLIPAILARLVAHKSYWEKIRKIFILIIVFNTLAQLTTLFVPLMFKINNGQYERTPFTYCYVLSMVICFILLLVASRKAYIQNSETTNLTLVSINILLFIGMIIRGNDIHSNADWLCITLGYFIFIIYYSNSYLKIDPITALANRRAFNSRLSHTNYSTAIVIIDANNFKHINDTYGHQCGDLALSKIAEAIFDTYNTIGYCYRTGGDEFTIIFKKNMLKKLTMETENCDTYRMVYNLIMSLNDKIRELAVEYPMVRFGVSQGFGIYFEPSETPTLEEHKTLEEVIKLADERMYKDKIRFKQEHKNSTF